jgi:uncharacterized protein
MKQLFINLPVSDLKRSMQFYLALGFTPNPLFTDEEQKCMVWSDSIYLMLQSRQFSNSYFEKQMIDARKHQMPSFTLPVGTVESVNEMMENGLRSGGAEPVPGINEGFMFLRSIEDIDGYVWGIMYLDLVKFQSVKTLDL